MEYTIKKLADLAGISTRTLRFYDNEGLLKPTRISSSGYRIYGNAAVDELQIIMLYRSLDFSVADIKKIKENKNQDVISQLYLQLERLEKKKEQTEALIDTVKKTILYKIGEITMSDNEKFESMKKKMIDENEKKYGDEIRKKYGDDNIKSSNKKFLNLREDEYKRMQELSVLIIEKIEACVKGNISPKNEKGAEIAALHKEWLMFTWSNYTKEAHSGLVEMYVYDDRFTIYYDKNIKGCAQFLRDAVKHWLETQ